MACLKIKVFFLYSLSLIFTNSNMRPDMSFTKGEFQQFGNFCVEKLCHVVLKIDIFGKSLDIKCNIMNMCEQCGIVYHVLNSQFSFYFSIIRLVD